jgi:6-phosphofructokinase 1
MPKNNKKSWCSYFGWRLPGMNAVRSVVRTCAYHIECIGIYRGYQGMIEGDFKEMGPRSVNNIVNKGGTILKSIF